MAFSCNNSQENVELIRFSHEHSDVEINVEYKLLNVTEDILIGNIDLFYVDERYIYLLQALSGTAGVYVFDKADGTYRTRIGNSGRGPGEYIMPVSFTVSDSTVSIVDGGTGKILHYSKEDFGYSGEIKCGNIGYFEWIDESELLCDNTTDSATSEFQNSCLVKTDTSLVPKQGYVDKIVRSGYVSGPLKPLYVYDGKVRAYFPFSPLIYEYKNSAMHPVYELSFDDTAFPPEDYVKKIARSGRDYTHDLRESGYVSYCEVHETEDCLLAFYMSKGKKYLAAYSKQDSKSWTWDEGDFMELVQYDPLLVAGVMDGRFVIPMSVSELKDSKNLPKPLDDIVINASDYDIILALIRFSAK